MQVSEEERSARDGVKHVAVQRGKQQTPEHITVIYNFDLYRLQSKSRVQRCPLSGHLITGTKDE